VAQFSKAGSYQSFDIAGFPIFLIRGKDDKIRAFHNVCRHRAYTITRKETGTSTVLGCRYHGWSYDTTGRLVKAPQFDGIPGFDKSENSLFEIYTHTTKQGWIFVNIDAGEPTCLPGSTALDLDRFARKVGLVSESKWLAGQTLTGTFNWKFGGRLNARKSSLSRVLTKFPLACARYYTDVTSHLENIVSAAAPPSLAAKIIKIFMPHSTRATCHLTPGSLIYSFENCPLWIVLSFVPASESTTRLRYDLFSLSSKTGVLEEEFADALARSINAILQKIENDFQTVIAESFDNNPQICQILNQLQEHARLEKKSGGQILPAMRQPKGSSLFQQAEQRRFSCPHRLDYVDTNTLASLQGNRMRQQWSWVKRWRQCARLVIQNWNVGKIRP
jgi:nitrite reductase/ring-hydroxylating ferredoxin subunit